MKQEDFRDYIKEPYLFHLHTRYTDGKLDAIDYFNFANENGVRTIVFTEHVRRDLKYDFSAFVSEIRRVEKEFPGIKAIIGAEAKLLPGGELDINQDTNDQIVVLCFACHGFPDDHELYFESFATLFRDDKWKDKIRVFVHPGRYLKKRHVVDGEIWKRLDGLIEIAVENGVFIEENKREMLPPSIDIVPEEWRIVGYDIHHESGLENWRMGENNGK